MVIKNDKSRKTNKSTTLNLTQIPGLGNTARPIWPGQVPQRYCAVRTSGGKVVGGAFSKKPVIGSLTAIPLGGGELAPKTLRAEKFVRTFSPYST